MNKKVLIVFLSLSLSFLLSLSLSLFLSLCVLSVINKILNCVRTLKTILEHLNLNLLFSADRFGPTCERDFRYCAKDIKKCLPMKDYWEARRTYKC